MENGLQSSAYVRRLQREIEEIEARIAELTEEKLALKRQLVKAHWEENALRDVSRKNSGTRIMVEERILDALRHARTPLSNTTLFETAKMANFELKPVTFRTYLKRLREKGKIQSVGRGSWVIGAVRPSSSAASPAPTAPRDGSGARLAHRPDRDRRGENG